MSLPPDLQVLCRRLASTAPDDLPFSSTWLVKHVLRCGDVLSIPSDQKSKQGSPEAGILVHKLKTQATTLLNGRSPRGRFVGAVLVKSIIDVGGWECLRSSEPWIRGLISIVQKNDTAKEVSVVTLTRIYTLLHEYQTLVREIATPTLPAFVAACLQLVKPPASGRPLTTPPLLIEAVADALSTIIPLYPTTLRPFATQIRVAFRPYLAPTSGDGNARSQSLERSARRLVILLHYTSPKNGNAEEWARAVDGFIRDSHTTADQVFRAVEESWESTSGYVRQSVPLDGEPHGGGDSPEELPEWSGLQSGSERLVGLIGTIAECFKCPTKTPVVIPFGAVSDFASRITLIIPPTKNLRREDGGASMNAAIGREEKDEFWSVLPDIHVATLHLLLAMISRLGSNILPLAPDLLYQVVRVVNASRHLPQIREAGFCVIRELLLLHGPNMDKTSVGSLDKVVQSCCRDLLSTTNYAQEEDRKEGGGAETSKTKITSSNADAFLASQGKARPASRELTPSHVAAATALLVALFSHMPQQHLAQNLRALMDRTAILCRSKEAMLASVLNPFRAKNGKSLPVILPFLTRQFPNDTQVEVLRSSLRSAPPGHGGTFGGDETFAELLEAPGPELSAGDDAPTQNAWTSSWLAPNADDTSQEAVASSGFGTSQLQVITETAVETVTTAQKETTTGHEQVVSSSILKRKSEEVELNAPKRIDTGKATTDLPAVTVQHKMDEDGDDSDSEGSVHIDMTLDDDLEGESD
ncbi:Pre-rRNA-processing protein rix1 [Pleurostoma richardsiae]|uniref:Pre-rRNA-processing protein RIX1 n=1 Tax=Pleurostoma richardsiae TaxID=41990 RepID=A0AA38VVL9_9PEZI|nr:Pre-rRNA-processing protein rix1 [Pleurostoma richardsiae]